MVKLCDAAGYVLQVELGVRVNKPRLAAVWPKHWEFQCNSVEWTRGHIGLVRGTLGQSWITRHRDTFELRFVCGSLWKKQGGRALLRRKKKYRNSFN